MNKLAYILDRLKEPGSVRSLVLALFLIRGWTVDEAQVAIMVDAALGLIAMASFLMPSSAPAIPKPEAIGDVVQKAVAQALSNSKS